MASYPLKGCPDRDPTLLRGSLTPAPKAEVGASGGLFGWSALPSWQPWRSFPAPANAAGLARVEVESWTAREDQGDIGYNAWNADNVTGEPVSASASAWGLRLPRRSRMNPASRHGQFRPAPTARR